MNVKSTANSKIAHLESKPIKTLPSEGGMGAGKGCYQLLAMKLENNTHQEFAYTARIEKTVHPITVNTAKSFFFTALKLGLARK